MDKKLFNKLYIGDLFPPQVEFLIYLAGRPPKPPRIGKLEDRSFKSNETQSMKELRFKKYPNDDPL